jgi:type III pantothenate kinase
MLPLLLRNEFIPIAIMSIAVDIGNTCIKCGIFFPDGKRKVTSNPLPKGDRVDEQFIHDLIQWKTLSESELLSPLIWRVAQTGSFPWKKIQAEICKKRPHDQFEILTHQQIPLKIDVDSPDKVGIDRLLAAVAAVKDFGGIPMLLVDAGTAITVDAVQNGTFCGGAILPGMHAQSETYPRVSKKLPVVQFSHDFVMKPGSPGKNTEDAVHNGCYWGTIGAIRLFYELFFPRKVLKKVLLILTGGDAKFLVPGLLRVFTKEQIKYHHSLVLEGINWCFEE